MTKQKPMQKRLTRIVGWIVATPTILFLVMTFLVYLPPIQQRLIAAATQAIAQSTGFHIQIQHVALQFPLGLSVKETSIQSPQGDTLAQADDIGIDIQLVPLLWKEIAIDGIYVSGLRIDTQDHIPNLHLSALVGEIFLDSHGIDIANETATINRISLSDADLSVAYTDSAATKGNTDTTSLQLPWKLLVENVDINDANIKFQMLPDSVAIASDIRHLSLRHGMADMNNSTYSLRSINLTKTSLTTDLDHQPPHEGFDGNHIWLSDISLSFDSLRYQGRNITALINQCAFSERSGLRLRSTKGSITSDSTHITIPRLNLSTDNSILQMEGSIDWNALQESRTGRLRTHIHSKIGKKDLQIITHRTDTLFQQHFPDKPLQLDINVAGNLDQLTIQNCNVTLTDAFDIELDGCFHHITDSLLRTAGLSCHFRAHDMTFLTPLTQGQLAIPQTTHLEANCELMRDDLNATAQLFRHASDSVPSASLSAAYSLSNHTYHVNAETNSLDLHDFLPADSIFHINTELHAYGQYFNPFSPYTSLHATAQLERLEYGLTTLSHSLFKADFEEHQFNIRLDSDNNLLKADAQLQGYIHPDDATAKLTLNINNLDWQALHLTPQPIRSQHTLNFDLQSNLREYHTLNLSLTDNIITNRRRPQKAKDLSIHFHTNTDSTQAQLSTGDLNIDFTAKEYAFRLSEQFTTLLNTIQQQWSSKHLSQSNLRELLPNVSLSITSGKENLIYNLLSINGFKYDSMRFQINADAMQGLNSSFRILGLQSDSVAIDTLYMNILQDTTAIHLQSGAIKNKSRDTNAFNAKLMGGINDKSGQLLLEYLNAQNQQGIYLGLQADLRQKGIRLHFFPEQPTIMYHPFTFNKRNTIYLSDRGRIYGNVQLHDESGSGLDFHTHFTDSVTKQDATLALQNINLHEIRNIYPFIPHLEGIFGTELHYIDTGTTQSLNADCSIRDFVYENTPLGTWEFGGTYLPNKQGEHFIDAYVQQNNKEILTLQGTYKEGKRDSLKAEVNLDHFPLDIVNPFIPDATLAMQGNINGTLYMNSPTDLPLLNGMLAMNNVAVDIPSASAHFAFCNNPLQMTNSRILFDDYKIYTHNKNPFTISGNVDLHDVGQTSLDLHLKTSNYELINAKKKRNAMLYGKLLVDLDATLKGNLDKLSLQGRMNVLGKSDFTYVLANSPLQVEDRLGELVTFTDFSQDQYAEEEDDSLTLNNSLSGFDILMTLHIDQAVRARINLTSDGSNYMMLEGGGDLSFQYTPQGEMLLNGRYALISGELKYDIPIIPLRTFNIKNGSYVQWNGPVLNPTLNITATERTRSSVGTRGQTPRMVAFDVGLQLKNQLQNLDMAFVLSAPEDASVQDQIKSMSAEEQNKIAVTMLVTGIYLAEGNTSGTFNASNTLNAFLQNQISNIAGQTMEMNFDMNDRTTEAGTQTDYNFQFAKRFWNNRFRIALGGTVSTGNVVANKQTFINNVSVEYRLDNSGTRNIKLFYDKNYQSILEGEITEMGLGVLLRKKVTNLGELFIFKQHQSQ